MRQVLLFNITPKAKESVARQMKTFRSEVASQIPGEVVETFRAYLPGSLFSACQKAIKLIQEQATPKDPMMIVAGTYEGFHKNVQVLTLLRDAQVTISFVDFVLSDDKTYSMMDHKSIDLLIHHLVYERTKQGNKISEGLRNSDKPIGLAAASPEKLQATTDTAKQGRTYKALTNEANVKARKAIQKLREVDDLNWSQIADQLNKQNILTRRGKQFDATGVMRQYQTIKKNKLVLESEEMSEALERMFQPLKNVAFQQLKVRGLSKGKNFTDGQLKVKLEGIPENVKAKLSIYHNDSTTPKLVRPLNVKEELVLNYQKQSDILMPGMYFARITAKGYRPFVCQFYIHKEILLPNLSKKDAS